MSSASEKTQANPSSGKWNYGRENCREFCRKWRLPHVVNYDMGPTALLPLRRKERWGFFFARKIRRLRPGLNPRTWVPKASTLTFRQPKPLSDFNYTWIFSTDFQKSPQLSNFIKKNHPSSGSRIVPWGRTDRGADEQTDRHDEANSRYPQICERA